MFNAKQEYENSIKNAFLSAVKKMGKKEKKEKLATLKVNSPLFIDGKGLYFVKAKTNGFVVLSNDEKISFLKAVKTEILTIE